jgi:hypothetical protein
LIPAPNPIEYQRRNTRKDHLALPVDSTIGTVFIFGAWALFYGIEKVHSIEKAETEATDT